MLNRIRPRRAPHPLEQDSQRLPTAPLKIFAGVLDAFPVPGAGAFAHSILNVAETINVSAHNDYKSLRHVYIFFAANQKGRHNGKVIDDLNRHIDSLVRVLDPISRLDRSKITPDLHTDIQALIRYAFIPAPRDLLLIMSIANSLSSPPNGKRKHLAAFSIAFLMTAEVQTKYTHWERVSRMLWIIFRFVCGGIYDKHPS